MHRRPGPGIVLVLLGCFVTAASAQTQHQIKLTRPLEVGQKLRVRSDGSFKVTITATTGKQPKELKTVSFTVNFDSVAEILKVDEHGRPVRVAYTINECFMTKRGHRSDIVPKGATLIARQGRDQKTIFFAKKSSPPGGARHFDELMLKALELTAGLESSVATDDELMGSSQPRRVGEEWPINSEAFAAYFQGVTPRKVGPENILGNVKLMRIMDHKGQPYQVIRTVLDARGLLPRSDRFPAGTRLKDAEFRIELSYLLPVDERLPRVADSMKTDIDATFFGFPGSQGAEGRLKGHIEARHHYTPLPSPATAAADP